MNRMLTLVIAGALFISSNVHAQTTAAGLWDGAIVLPGVNLGIMVHLKGPDSSLKATIDIPMQLALGLPLKNVTLKNGRLRFELPAGPGLATFEGPLTGDSIAGDFRQGTIASRFHLKRVGPPDPDLTDPPVPYRSEEVKVQNGEVSLAGTLTLPPGKGPFAAVVLLTGSGAQDRDEEIFGFTPFKILADTLSRAGIAVLRCDDRGVGGSTGSMAGSTSADFAGDARAMRKFLAGRPEIDPKKIGLLGHSEGALVAAMVAAQDPGVPFIVLLAGPSIPGDSVILSQIAMLGKGQGMADEDLRRSIALERHALACAKQDAGWDELQGMLTAEMRRERESMPDDQKRGLTDSIIDVRVGLQMKSLRSPWFRSFVSHDPASDLRKVGCPVLALFAELDQQVPPSLNRGPMEEALRSAGNHKADFRILPGANHLFQQARTGSPTEYASLEKKFTGGLLPLVTDWLLSRSR
jgi:uncharacterized protein